MANADSKAEPAEAVDVEAGETMTTANLGLAGNVSQADRDEPSDAIDPVFEALLAQLWEAANETGGKIWSLAKLSKRAQIPQSSLRRYLTSLTEAGLVTVTLDEAGFGSSTLTEFGRSVCEDLFGAPPARP
jgi:hypothetical protein